MKLSEAYLRMFAGCLNPDTLKKILREQYFGVTVQLVSSGKILLSNGKIVKCVSHYFSKPSSPITKPMKQIRNKIFKCRLVKKYLGIEDIGDLCCVQCHLRCASLFDDKILVRQK